MTEIAGLKLIVPSSVSKSGSASVSVTSTGKINFSGVNSSNIISVNGCFYSTYDNYLIVIRATFTGSADAMQIRWRASGSDNSTTSSYSRQELDVNGITVSGSRVSLNTGFVGGLSSSGPNGKHLYVYGPYLAQPTSYRGVDVSGHSSVRILDYSSTHNQSTSYDGFSLFCGGDPATMSGALTIYGFSQ